MRPFLIFIVLLPIALHGAHHRIDPIPERLDDEALIIDVRSEAEYRNEHLAGAVNVPYQQIAERIGDLAGHRDREIVLYCTVGMRAHHAKEDLVALGYTRVLNLGGIDRLKKAGFAVD